MDIDLQKLKDGDRRTLAKAITLIESSNPNHRKSANLLLDKIKNNPHDSMRIGISGSPGVGKSTFVETFGEYLISLGHKVAVLAIDPSSPIAGGSILGDKTQMEKLSQNKDAFIRPSPSSGTLGGVANKTKETIILCEVAGFDITLVETVGVGQSEHDVANIVDFFLLLILPGGGDQLQGIKKGILEFADLIVVNKEDLNSNLAKSTQQEYQNALRILSSDDQYQQVLTCSAEKNIGVQKIWEIAEKKLLARQVSGATEKNRTEQEIRWLDKLIIEGLQIKLKTDQDCQKSYNIALNQIRDKKSSAFESAQNILKLFFS
ncbi:MAG: methylmalonyl Co-A mutase-associated GTPase MeaB [Bacteriovoracaceae bacterium]|jgi:LAO/AO transport system kinase|nr:methylmalonyl Co-A mutase-associated GTPase MeaB [Bacteriovoracaceae bacterium]